MKTSSRGKLYYMGSIIKLFEEEEGGRVIEGIWVSIFEASN